MGLADFKGAQQITSTSRVAENNLDSKGEKDFMGGEKDTNGSKGDQKDSLYIKGGNKHNLESKGAKKDNADCGGELVGKGGGQKCSDGGDDTGKSRGLDNNYNCVVPNEAAFLASLNVQQLEEH